MIFFIRHGATDWNDCKNEQGILSPKCQGRVDCKLNAHGIEQAKLAAEFLKNIEFEKVFCSPLMRAKQTLEIVYQGNTKPIFDERLIERDFGTFEGLTRAEFDFKKFWTIGSNYNNPTAESLESVKSRVKNLLLELTNYDEKNVLLVSHGGVGCVLLSYFKALPEKDFYLSLEMPHGSPIILNPKEMKI